MSAGHSLDCSLGLFRVGRARSVIDAGGSRSAERFQAVEIDAKFTASPLTFDLSGSE